MTLNITPVRVEQMEFVPFTGLKHFSVFFSRRHLDRLEKAGAFPRRVMMSSRFAMWKTAEIRAWLKAKEAERNREENETP